MNGTTPLLPPVPMAARSKARASCRSFESHQRAWMSCLLKVLVLSGRGLCDGPITRPEESYRVSCVCDSEVSTMRRPWPTRGCRTMRKKNPTPAYAFMTCTPSPLPYDHITLATNSSLLWSRIGWGRVKTVMRWTSGCRWEEVVGEWTKLPKAEIHNQYPAQNIIGVMTQSSGSQSVHCGFEGTATIYQGFVDTFL